MVAGKAIKIEPGTQLNTITTYPTSTTTATPTANNALPIIPQATTSATTTTTTNLRAIPTANLTNKPMTQCQLPQAATMTPGPMGTFNIRITKDMLAGPNRNQQQTSAWIANNTGIILSPSLTIRQIGEVRSVPTTSVHHHHPLQMPTITTQPAYLVPQVWRSASFKSTSKPTVMPTLVSSKKRTGAAAFAVPPAPVERKESTSNDLEMFTASNEEEFDSDEEDSDAERVLGHSDDNMYEDDEEDENNVTVDDDYKPPYSSKGKQMSRQYSSSGGGGASGNDSKKEDQENSKDIKYVAGNDKPWVCKNCNRQYKWKNSLKCHLKNECGLPPKYFCSRDCGYKTNVHSNLKRHLNSKFCKSRDPPTDELLAAATEMEIAPGTSAASPLLTVIKEEPL